MLLQIKYYKQNPIDIRLRFLVDINLQAPSTVMNLKMLELKQDVQARY